MGERAAPPRSYQDLRVWQQAMDLAELAYRETACFPREEAFGLTSQIRRAASSVPANIAEGNGRETTGNYVQHLRIAQGSLKELETHLLLSSRVGFLSNENCEQLLKACTSVGVLLRRLIRSLQTKL